ncbi:reverse transcriptase domain-containing protein, partial [Pseudomonas aeruginosa]|uniref:reverse transcriptase domain-containing protein n=1 Tax=Pseudomonas aeruginosa TaxID=287 RepID=UPI00257560C1
TKQNHVFKLSKALYGLKQVPRAWYDRLSKFLLNKNFIRGKIDTTLFIKFQNKYHRKRLIVQIYVDDIIFGATNEDICRNFADCMQKEFKMSMMGELTFFLGLQIRQSKDGILINQAKYVKDMLKRFNLENIKALPTPMSPSTKLDADEKGKPVDQILYRGMIGSLLYLTASRPDIMFSVCLCARFQANPRESHLVAVKRIFRYLAGTCELGLFYPKNAPFNLISYSDADYDGCKTERK